MIRLRTFGSVDVRDDEAGVLTSVLAQPKRLALLVYLAAARPAGLHRRDRLLALFWPELDDARARDALSQALHFLRQGLGADAFMRRGEEVGVDPSRVWCDAVAFRDALSAGRPNDAMELYAGDFLAGFFVEQAYGFEEWSEGERGVFREEAARAAQRLAHHHEAAGTLTLAMDWGRRALELNPDERELRRVLGVYDRAGDRVGGLRLYNAFARRMLADFDWVPSPESQVVIDQLRTDGLPAKTRADTFGQRHQVVRGPGSGTIETVPPEQPLGEPAATRRAFAWYVAAVAGVSALAWAATAAIGLPDWVLPGTLVVMGAGLPVMVLTAANLSRHLTWRRVTLGGAAAVGGFATLVLVYMVMRVNGLGPPGTLLSAGSLPDRPRLVITDFSVKSADSALAGPASDAVRISLGQSRVVRLVDRAEVQNALRRMERAPSTRVDVNVAREVATREGVAAIVDGDVTGYSGGFIITLRLLNATTGTVLAGPFRAATPDFIQGVDEVARELRSKIGEPLKSVRASAPLFRTTTSSLEALRLYSEATRIEQTQNRIPVLRRAVALDSNFATAWRTLANVMTSVGYPQASVDTAITRAYQLRHRLGREGYFEEAMYFSIGPTPARRRAIEAWEAVRRAGDSSVASANNMGLAYNSRRDWPRAESLFRLALSVVPERDREPGARRRPPYPPLYNLLVPLHARGKLGALDSIIAITRKEYPRDYSGIVNALRVRYARGRVADYDRALDSVRRDGLGGRGPITTRANAQVAQLRGRLIQAEKLWGEMAVLDSTLRVRHTPLADSLRVAHFDAWHRGRPERAVARLDTALTVHPLSTLAPIEQPHTAIAAIYALGGRADRPRAILGQLTGSRDTILIARKRRLIHGALAEIALAENRPRDAIAEFRRSDVLPDGPADENPLRVLANLGRAFDRANEPDSAIAYYERYLETPYFFRMGGRSANNAEAFELYEPSDAVFLAHIYRRLGELREMRGDRARASELYAKFIELWGGADPELQPTVDEIRARLSRLQPDRRRD